MSRHTVLMQVFQHETVAEQRHSCVTRQRLAFSHFGARAFNGRQLECDSKLHRFRSAASSGIVGMPNSDQHETAQEAWKLPLRREKSDCHWRVATKHGILVAFSYSPSVCSWSFIPENELHQIPTVFRRSGAAPLNSLDEQKSKFSVHFAIAKEAAS